jgi:hypothetical protein
VVDPGPCDCFVSDIREHDMRIHRRSWIGAMNTVDHPVFQTIGICIIAGIVVTGAVAAAACE